MGKALYRKYRPKNLDEVVGQEHITKTLANSLKSNNVSHAYLFTGPRGVGKTSIARILAHEVNELEYDESANHLDIIEIDAASNRRIDEIRELREKVHNAPTSVKFKVYIIDEVHMLTKEAFNALLKTLEEPPEHAIFILATTESHKLPDTIISRCIRFTFRPVDSISTVDHLKSIADTENINVDKEALELIAQHGSGSFRDSISLLDQLGSQGGNIDLETTRRALGLAPQAAIEELLEIVSKSDISATVNIVQELLKQGYSAPQLASQLSEKLRQALLDNDDTIDKAQASKLLKSLLNVPASHDPATLLEITLLESVIESAPSSTQPPKQTHKTPAKPSIHRESDGNKSDKDKAKKQEEQPEQKADSLKQENIKPTPAPKAEGSFDNDKWTAVLNELKKERNTLYGIARMAEPRFDGGEVVLVFRFPFHKRRFDDAKNKQIISEIIKQTTGHNIAISSIIEQDSAARPDPEPLPKETPESEDDIKAISDIFGDAEVLE